MAQPTPLRPTKSAAPVHLAAEEAELYGQIVRAYGLRDENGYAGFIKAVCWG
jgi:hypothetical protein